MQIRQASDLDIPELLKLEEAAQAIPWSEEAFKRCFEANYYTWVADVADKMLGFIVLSIAAGECHVLNLCVYPVEQRKGFGRDLLIYALNWAKQQGAGIAYLEVRRSNVAAIGLYRNMNFKLIGERKNYYQHGSHAEDALVFARDLNVEDAEIK